MTLLDQLQNDLKTSLKARNQPRLEAIRFFLSRIKYDQIQKQQPLTDPEILNILKNEVKTREEAIVLFKQGNRQDLVETEEEKLRYLKEYLPEQLNDQELNTIVVQTINENPDQKGNFGFLIKTILTKTQGGADGAKVAQLLKKLL
jgi:hypothetical protein